MDLRELTTYEACILHARAHRVLREFVARQLEGYNLTVMEWVLLGVISESKPGVSPSALCERLDVSMPLITRMATNLQSHGYVDRKEHQEDKRQSVIIPSAKGLELAELVEAQIKVEMRKMLKDFSPSEILGYVRTMKQLAELL